MAIPDDSQEDLRLEPQATVVIYDKNSGDVVLVHHFSAMPGVSLPGSEELSEMAMRYAADETSRAPESLAALQVRPADLKPHTTYKVSPRDGTLIEERPAGL